MAQQQAFDLSQLLQQANNQASFQAAQVGLPNGASFNMTPNAMPQQKQGADWGKILNVLGYVGQGMSDLQNGDIGGLLSNVGTRYNTQQYNQALQNARVNEAMQAMQQRQQLVTDRQTLAGRKDLQSPEVLKEYTDAITLPLQKRQGETEQNYEQGRNEAESLYKLKALLGGSDSLSLAMPKPQPQTQSSGGMVPLMPVFSPDKDGITRQADPAQYMPQQQPISGGVSSTGISPDVLDVIKTLNVSPESLRSFSNNFTTEAGQRSVANTAKVKLQEDIRQFGIKQALENQKLRALEDYRAGLLAAQEERNRIYKNKPTGSSSPTRITELQAAVKSGKMTYDAYLNALANPWMPVEFAPSEPSAPTGKPTPAKAAPKATSKGKYGLNY